MGFGKKLLNIMIDESLKHNVKKVTLEVKKILQLYHFMKIKFF